MAYRKIDFNIGDILDDPEFSTFFQSLEKDGKPVKPIHIAAEIQDLSLLSHLLDWGVPPDECSSYTFMDDYYQEDKPSDLETSTDVTPLMVAAAVDFDGGVRELLRRGAKLEKRDSSGRTALWYAAAFHAKKALTSLISAGANVNAADHRGNTPLAISVYCPNQPYILTELLSAGADPNLANKERRTPLHLAVANGTVTQVKALLDAKANPHIKDSDGWVPLWHCTSNAEPYPLLELLRPFGSYWTEKDLNLCSRRNPIPLFANACMQCANPNFIRQLIEEGANVNIIYPTGKTPLTLAVSTCNEAAYSTLLECGADPNQRDDLGMTPLLIALAQSDSRSVSTLLLNGANINEPDPLGQTPLDYALSQFSDLKFLTYLLDQGANINALDHQNCTPLMHATRNANETAVIKLLLKRGADPNVINKHGETALHLAAEDADPYFLRALLDGGADPCLVDSKRGISALDKAVRNDSLTCVRHLINALPHSADATNILRKSLRISLKKKKSRATVLIKDKLDSLG